MMPEKGEKGRAKASLLCARLEKVFGDIAATRMAGLPILNPALWVQAVGFREWQGHWLGVLVTPWSIGLILLAGEEALPFLGPDQTHAWHFPSGNYAFMGLEEPELGLCHVCSLQSPVLEFATQEDAVTFAEAALDELFRTVPDTVARGTELADMVEEVRLNGASLADKEVSRRDFLRIPFLAR